MNITKTLATGKCDFTKDVDIETLPLYQRINYLHAFILVLPPLMLAYAVSHVVLHPLTFLLALVTYVFTGWGITAGYHRLWSHVSYQAHPLVQFFLAFWAAGAFEGSARWWCRNHRAHHRYTDTDKDPYAVHKGFWYAHIGWMIFKQEPKKIGKADISDLNANPVLQFQHKYYLELALTSGIILPTLIAGYFWGDYLGGYLYAGIGRTVFVHHSTFLINSAAHYFGERPYSTEHTARDNIITAFLTLGEGYHNFHHEFPHDYRNGVRKWQWDPTKWFIYGLSLVGLTYNLHSLPREDWRKARIQVKKDSIGHVTSTARAIQESKIDKEGKKYNWGPSVESLPVWSQVEVNERVSKGELLIIFNDIVHDAKKDNWVNEHPGGAQFIEFFNGRDATTAMEGEVYRHTKNARNKLAVIAVARYAEDTRITYHESNFSFGSLLQSRNEDSELTGANSNDSSAASVVEEKKEK